MTVPPQTCQVFEAHMGRATILAAVGGEIVAANGRA